jgi:hypothetical protein
MTAPNRITADLDDESLAFLALAEPLVAHARDALGGTTHGPEDVHVLLRGALAFIVTGEPTRAANMLATALAGLEAAP